MTKTQTQAVARGSFESFALSTLRVVTGLVFLYHGLQKLFGLFDGIDAHGGSALLMSPLWIAGVIEVAGAVLIISGMLTRPVASILCAEMLFIYYRHHAHGLLPVLGGGADVALLCCAILLYLSAAGAGSLSFDRILEKRVEVRGNLDPGWITGHGKGIHPTPAPK